MRKEIEIVLASLMFVFLTGCYEHTEQAALNIAVGSDPLNYADNFISEVKNEKVFIEIGFSQFYTENIITILDKAEKNIQDYAEIFFSKESDIEIPEVYYNNKHYDKAVNPMYYYLHDLRYKTEKTYDVLDDVLLKMISIKRNAKQNAILFGLAGALGEQKSRLIMQMEVKFIYGNYYPRYVKSRRRTPAKEGLDVEDLWKLAKDNFSKLDSVHAIIEQDVVQSFYISLDQHIQKLKNEGIFFDQTTMHKIPSPERLKELKVGFWHK